MKLTKKQLKTSIQQETINGETIFYSLGQKCQATFSMLKNQRLLILNTHTGLLYYINQPKQLPFLNEIPKPKKQCANIQISIVKNPPPDLNQIIIQFATLNQKNQQVRMQWNFVFENKILAKQWVNTIKDYKNKIINQILNQNKPVEQKKQQTHQPTNNAFIHDTLGFGALQGLRKSQQIQSKTQQPPSNQSKLQQQQLQRSQQNSQQIVQTNKNKVTQSNINRFPESNIKNSNLRQSRDPNFQNLQKSNADKYGYQQSYLVSPNKNQESPQMKRSQMNDDMNKSKLTLRYQLQSILERSQLRQSKFQNISYNQRSRTSNKDNNYKPENDWNLKFLKHQDQNVLLDFQIFAEKAFFNILSQDDKSQQSLRCYFKDQTIILVANARTSDAKKLKSQFRNYHFIMQSCKTQFLVGVPLASLIQFQGLVALVKSCIPEQAQKLQLTQSILLDLKDLQRYTRIKNNILQKASLYDLSQIYDSKGRRLIYIDNLIQYLPIHIDDNFRGCCLRPEHILDNVNTFMQGGIAHQANRNDMKVLNQTLDLVRKNVYQLAKQLSNQDIFFVNPIQLKNVMHQRGINLKYLPLLYNEVTNKNVKKYINTIMVAKVVKDNLIQNISALRLQTKKVTISQIVQNSYRLLIEGNTNVSSELWKQIAINFRKQYGIPMSNHDILGPFFLNCLIKILPGKYDLSKLNDKKAFFKQQGIINKGFVVQLYPKIKSYYRYTTQLTQKIEITCKGQKLAQNFDAIVSELQLKTKPIPRIFYLNKVNEPLKQYLSYYACPNQFDSRSFAHLNLYENVGIQPPTINSLMITKNYLDWCLDKQKYDQFKHTLEETLLLIDFWLDPSHPVHCQFYQSLSNYYQLTGAVDQSINFMKQSLGISIRSGGVTSKKTGYKYYELAQKQLRAGRKNDSMQNFIKAKNNMENYNDQSMKYPITLMKLSSLYLNSSEFDNCISYSKLAVQKFELIQSKNKSSTIPKGYYDQYCIKAIQIMTRAFEIQNKKTEFYKIAQLAAAKYNKTKSPYVFQQLMKISVTAVIFKHAQQKCKIFEGFIEKLSQAKQQGSTPQKCLEQLMHLANQFNVMERFMFKFQSLQRIVSDINSRRPLSNDAKQFVHITTNILGCIGQDYVYGLVQQKQFQ